MEIVLCVGSSCHLKGSHAVVARLQALKGSAAILGRLNALIAEYHLEGQVTLSGSFCMDQCTRGNSGVCIKIDNQIHSVTAATIDDVFRREVVQKLSGGDPA